MYFGYMNKPLMEYYNGTLRIIVFTTNILKIMPTDLLTRTVSRPVTLGQVVRFYQKAICRTGLASPLTYYLAVLYLIVMRR